MHIYFYAVHLKGSTGCLTFKHSDEMNLPGESSASELTAQYLESLTQNGQKFQAEKIRRDCRNVEQTADTQIAVHLGSHRGTRKIEGTSSLMDREQTLTKIGEEVIGGVEIISGCE